MRRLTATCLAAVTLSTGATALLNPAGAAASRQVSVTIHLASHAHAVARLARSTGLSHRDRLGQLRAAVATPAARRDVAGFLAQRGFHVVDSSPFVVRAEASEQTVDATFAGSSSQPALPDALKQAASFVVRSDEQTGMLKPLRIGAPLSGSDVRTLYGAPAGTPPTGHHSPTVATLQFSGWNPADLATFAVDNGLADPLATGQYRAVSVDGADPTVPDGSDGQYEVALDQEALLMTAPHARQAAYFAPNDGGGIIDAIEQVATDAYNGANIGALSISYGLCETDLPADFLAAVHQAVADALASGVTVFAASGDSGAYECAPGQVSVPSPASDPLVVAVGGTTVTATTPTPQETVWWDGTDGSGGGTSGAFVEPAYQKTRAPGLPGRGIPDISLDGDPESGIVIDVDGLTGVVGGTSLASPLAAATFVDLLSTNGTDYGIGDIHRNLYGAPAADFRDITLGSNGAYTAGAGYDLASGLGAPRWSALRDALVGFPTVRAPAISPSRSIPVAVSVPAGMVFDAWKIGTEAEPPGCGRATSSTPPTSVQATTDGTARIYVIGYTLSGYCYVDHATTRVDTVAPVAASTARLSRSSKRSARFTWTATDHAPATGVVGYRVSILKTGSPTAVFQRDDTDRQSFTLNSGSRGGATYVVHVSAVDAAGNRSDVSSARVTLA